MEEPKTPIKVLIVQNNPEYKQPDKNLSRLTEMLSKYSEKDGINIVLFTEMALTGYFFDSKEDIYPFTEYCNEGKTFTFCSELAKRLNSFVCMGYPEKTRNDSNLYNSLMVVSNKGELLTSYHKVNLFKDDKKWCTPGNDLAYLEITINNKTVKITMAICLDIYYSLDFDGSFEFSKFCIEKNPDLILFPTNWADERHSDNSKNEIITSIFEHWLFPLIAISGNFKLNNLNKNVYFLAADRIGQERNVYLFGCSCIASLSQQINLNKWLDKNNEGIIEEILYI